jgi:hypothetical protein
VTSRPLLLAAVGKAASHAGQTQLYLTPLHAKTQAIKSLIANVRKALQHVALAAEQLPSINRWTALLRYICVRIVPSIPSKPPTVTLAATG